MTASGGGTVNFLRADGTWAAPAVGAASLVVGTTTITGGTSTRVLYDNAGILGEYTGTQITALLDLFTTALKGVVPSSGGGTVNFLRADGTWAAPPGGAGVPAGSTGQVQYNNAGAFGAVNMWVESANVTAQRNSTNPQSIYVYNSYTSPIIYERGAFDWTTNSAVLTIGTQAAGGGSVQRQVTFVGGGAGMYFNWGSPAKNWAMTGSGASGIFYSDNVGLDYSNGDVILSRASARVLAIGNGNGDSSATIQAKTKAGAPVATDFAAGTWALIRDTTNLTTNIYYNNAGTLQTIGSGIGTAGGSGITGGVVHGVAITNAATTIASNVVLGANQFLVGQASADPIAQTATQVTALLNVFTSTLNGLVPLSGGGTTNFLRADGTWAAAGGAGGTPGGSSGQVQYNNAGAFGGTNIWVEDANTRAHRNGTTAQVLRVYNTYTDASNYERGVFDWTTTANTLTIGTQAAGTGTNRSLVLTVAGGGTITMATAGNITFNNGGSPIIMLGGGQLLQVNGYTVTNAIVLDYVNADTGISRSAAGVIAIGNGGAGDSSACIKAKTKAGAPTTTDVPSGTWTLIRDTSGATTKLYYNNAGTLMSVALT